MRYFYKFITYLLDPLLILFLKKRIEKGKEDPTRYEEKLGKTKIKIFKNVIWFHAASLGEVKSIAPIIKHYQKNKKLKILITTVTISSYDFFKKNLESENTIHQYAPIDSPKIVKKFIKLWQPRVSIFVESEIWPNLIEEASRVSKLILLNCRISKNSFKKWKNFKKFFNDIIINFEIITVQNNETAKYLEYFNIKNFVNTGNLKFLDYRMEKRNSLDIKNLDYPWVAMSIHFEEVNKIIDVHKLLLKKYETITTFLIPRHLNKIEKIKNIILEKKINLKLTSEDSTINNFNGIVLVNQFGIADEIFNKTKIVFMGGSFINHGGQNPIEPARCGCLILHGKNIFNFTDVYNFLEKNNISKLTKDTNDLANEICFIFQKKNFTKNKINMTFSNEILNKTTNLLDKYIL